MGCVGGFLLATAFFAVDFGSDTGGLLLFLVVVDCIMVRPVGLGKEASESLSSPSEGSMPCFWFR